MALEPGDAIPVGTLIDSEGGELALASLTGAPLLLYFYPKDDTPGCTREAQEFSAAKPAFDALGVRLLGVSRDDAAKHRKFAAKYDLTVPLASDPDGAVLEAFGAWVEKSLYGKKYMGIDRSTFLFDASGRLVRAWRKVKVSGHVDAVLDAAKAMTAA